MEITEVQIKIVEPKLPHVRLRAYASVVLDHSFCVNDLKVVQGTERLFVAMPARRLNVRCSECGTANQVQRPLGSCIRCDASLPDPKPIYNREGEEAPLYVDIFHPIHQQARSVIDAAVLHAYQEEVDRQTSLSNHVHGDLKC